MHFLKALKQKLDFLDYFAAVLAVCLCPQSRLVMICNAFFVPCKCGIDGCLHFTALFEFQERKPPHWQDNTQYDKLKCAHSNKNANCILCTPLSQEIMDKKPVKCGNKRHSCKLICTGPLFTQQLCEAVSPPAPLLTSDPWNLRGEMDHATFVSGLQVSRWLFPSFCLLQNNKLNQHEHVTGTEQCSLLGSEYNVQY